MPIQWVDTDAANPNLCGNSIKAFNEISPPILDPNIPMFFEFMSLSNLLSKYGINSFSKNFM